MWYKHPATAARVANETGLLHLSLVLLILRSTGGAFMLLLLLLLLPLLLLLLGLVPTLFVDCK
jgi:hypothetical protein